MASSMLRRLLFCTFGKHARSRGKAVEIGGNFQSQCKYCGVQMHKSASGKWLRR